MFELRITLRNSSTSLTDSHLLYEPITLDHNDERLQKLVKASLNKFTPHNSEAHEKLDITLKAKMVWQ